QHLSYIYARNAEIVSDFCCSIPQKRGLGAPAQPLAQILHGKTMKETNLYSPFCHGSSLARDGDSAARSAARPRAILDRESFYVRRGTISGSELVSDPLALCAGGGYAACASIGLVLIQPED